MPVGLALLAAFVLTPLAEIAVLIQVGGLIGLWPTLALVVLTAVLGSVMIRLQGLAVVARVRHELDRGALPVEGVLDGVCLLVAGVLLLTPGFITDALGALLLLPPVRRALYRRAKVALERRRAEAEAAMRRRDGAKPPVIEADYEEVEARPEDDDMPPPGGGWGRR